MPPIKPRNPNTIAQAHAKRTCHEIDNHRGTTSAMPASKQAPLKSAAATNSVANRLGRIIGCPSRVGTEYCKPTLPPMAQYTCKSEMLKRIHAAKQLLKRKN